VAEYRVEVDPSGSLPVLRIELEAATDVAKRVGQAIRNELFIGAEITAVPPGTLPRYEMKARRFTTKTQRTQRRTKENIT
jgi:phenylacetate-CoA ligase